MRSTNLCPPWVFVFVLLLRIQSILGLKITGLSTDDFFFSKSSANFEGLLVNFLVSCLFLMPRGDDRGDDGGEALLLGLLGLPGAITLSQECRSPSSQKLESSNCEDMGDSLFMLFLLSSSSREVP